MSGDKGTIGFDEALRLMKTEGMRMQRFGWHLPVLPEYIELYQPAKPHMYHSWIRARIGRKYEPWMPTHADLLAEDWMDYEP